MDNDQKFISHFGVPGMRWGIRRGLRNGSTPKLSNKVGNKAIKQDAKTIKKLYNVKVALILNSDKRYPKSKDIMDEKLMKTTWNNFIDSMKKQKGKSYVDSVFNEVNKNRY